MGTWTKGTWHLLEVTRPDPEYDDLEFDESHPRECPWELIYEGMVRRYTCLEGWHLENCGFENFGHPEPGSYKFRVSYWSGDAFNDTDEELEVERLDEMEAS